jgi:hypothetical protein
MMSEAQKAALAKAQKSSPLHAQMQRHGVESLDEGREIPEGAGAVMNTLLTPENMRLMRSPATIQRPRS